MCHPAYEGRIVFVVEPISEPGASVSRSFLAVDAVGACPGQLVLVAREGGAARLILDQPTAPFHSAIVGIVDTVDAELDLQLEA